MLQTNNSGFSVTEMLIAVLILGVLLVIGIPTISAAMADYRINDATMVISTAIQRARYQASSGNAPCGIEVDPTSRQVTVWQETDWDLTSHTPVIATYMRPLGVTCSVDFGGTDPKNILVFESDGSREQLGPAAPPVDSEGIARPQVLLSAKSMTGTVGRELRISRFGEVIVKDH